ncbi:UNVERIFIED_CONTAM: hypothetical protein HDU68_003038 [Siphonaria sp. JEL0065]|nr:hypothetical protein HDU68_003038 [Siphonaria sp. JEL0065]
MCHFVHPVLKTSHYFCLACEREYKTPGGLKYHLNESSCCDFPGGYYWPGKDTLVRVDGGGESGGGDIMDGSDAINEESIAVMAYGSSSRYSCLVAGCEKRYTALSGLKYHLKHGHV